MTSAIAMDGPDPCIVCLGDLRLTDNDVLSPPAAAVADDETIAHLLPCGHNLHNECLKPWVERANSCPICRRNFNEVELKTSLLGKPVRPIQVRSQTDLCMCVGSTLSSYAVQDKQQVADLDPDMLFEEEEEEYEELSEACLICDRFNYDDILLLCDGCDGCFHTYCVGLDAVPSGAWFCQNCLDNGTIRTTHATATNSTTRPTNNRTGPRRSSRRRGRRAAPTSEWSRVWQSVWDNLNLDLDFPYDNDNDDIHGANHGDYAAILPHQWRRRLQVAQRYGSGARFRDTAIPLLNGRLTRAEMQPPAPRPETQEEISAWSAFERAREQQQTPVRPTNKRKSRSASPADEPEPEPEPERRLKRPRTRRTQTSDEPASDAGVESSRRGTTRRAAASTSPSTATTRHAAPTTNTTTSTAATGPSFLQSLLKEVEARPSSADDDEADRHRVQPIPTRLFTSVLADPLSPSSLSPGSSPTTSNHPSPRAQSATPPPRETSHIHPPQQPQQPQHHVSRPSSPPPLTSCIEPIFAQQHPTAHAPTSPADFSPASPSLPPPPPFPSHTAPPLRHPRTTTTTTNPTTAAPRLTTRDTSPSMSLEDKTEIQRMVSAALRPAYRGKVISTDQYTDICRDVSRMLYEMVGASGGLGVGGREERERWGRLAAEEVRRCLRRVGQRGGGVVV